MYYNKEIYFEKELKVIRNGHYRKFLMEYLNKIPEDFFQKPASSSGRHHSATSQGEMGLINHTKHAFWVGYWLMKSECLYKFTDRQKDLLLGAILLHDSIKYGFEGSERTVHEHPLLPALLIQRMVEDGIYFDDEIEAMALETGELIKTHSGAWTTSRHSEVVLEAPTNEMEKFIHLCDYISSMPFNSLNEENIRTKDEEGGEAKWMTNS